jgi:hypothetical protein
LYPGWRDEVRDLERRYEEAGDRAREAHDHLRAVLAQYGYVPRSQ